MNLKPTLSAFAALAVCLANVLVVAHVGLPAGVEPGLLALFGLTYFWEHSEAKL